MLWHLGKRDLVSHESLTVTQLAQRLPAGILQLQRGGRRLEQGGRQRNQGNRQPPEDGEDG